MFAPRYFAPRHFAPRYFPPGAPVAASGPAYYPGDEVMRRGFSGRMYADEVLESFGRPGPHTDVVELEVAPGAVVRLEPGARPAPADLAAPQRVRAVADAHGLADAAARRIVVDLVRTEQRRERAGAEQALTDDDELIEILVMADEL